MKFRMKVMQKVGRILCMELLEYILNSENKFHLAENELSIADEV